MPCAVGERDRGPGRSGSPLRRSQVELAMLVAIWQGLLVMLVENYTGVITSLLGFHVDDPTFLEQIEDHEDRIQVLEAMLEVALGLLLEGGRRVPKTLREAFGDPVILAGADPDHLAAATRLHLAAARN